MLLLHKKLKQVTEGAIIKYKGAFDVEVHNRIQANNWIISLKPKLNVFLPIYMSTLKFKCENWILNQAQFSKLQGMEMKYLRMAIGHNHSLLNLALL